MVRPAGGTQPVFNYGGPFGTGNPVGGGNDYMAFADFSGGGNDAFTYRYGNGYSELNQIIAQTQYARTMANLNATKPLTGSTAPGSAGSPDTKAAPSGGGGEEEKPGFIGSIVKGAHDVATAPMKAIGGVIDSIF